MSLQNLVPVATIILAIAAMTGAFIAYKQLKALSIHQRRDTFLKLLDEVTSKSSRSSRAILHLDIEDDEPSETIKACIDRGRKKEATTEEKNLKDAIEETIVSFDKIGYFLQKDTSLKDEAPQWIWTITYGMWRKLGSYVIYRQEDENSPAWGKYFRALAEEAEKRQEQ